MTEGPPRSRIVRKEKRHTGSGGALAQFIGASASLTELTIVAIVSVITTLTITTVIKPSLAPPAVAAKDLYNHSRLAESRTLKDGSVEWDILVVTDLDHDSKHPEKKNTWRSFAKRGVLTISKNQAKASVSWDDAADFEYSTQISAGGRAMELSDLVVFNGKLLSIDDRTGIVYQLDKKTAIPWVLLNDGPGNVTKGLKGEWMTVKDESLFVGGLGKEWTTTEGEYVNDHPMWVKQVSAKGEVDHINWKEVFIKVRAAIGIHYPGYMIHEAVQWSPVHRKWYFLPRRASNEKYTEAADEGRGTNVLIEVDDTFRHFRAIRIGGGKADGPGHGSPRGYSAFQFIPNTNDNLIVALKSEEKDGVPVASYLSVFTLEGKIVLDDSPLKGTYKYEGLEFVSK